jgi:hypothetical protein
MPKSSQALAADLMQRRPYKEALEISYMGGPLYERLEKLFGNSERRRHIECSIAQELAYALDREIADHEFLFDIPRPEKWHMDVWIAFENPPIGMEPLMTWSDATGLTPRDLGRYEQHRRRMRVVVPEHLRQPLLEHRDDVLLPILERLVP